MNEKPPEWEWCDICHNPHDVNDAPRHRPGDPEPVPKDGRISYQERMEFNRITAQFQTPPVAEPEQGDSE